MFISYPSSSSLASKMLLFIAVEDDIQKQPFTDVFQNKCS